MLTDTSLSTELLCELNQSRYFRAILTLRKKSINALLWRRGSVFISAGKGQTVENFRVDIYQV